MATADFEIFSDFNCVWCYFSTENIENLEKEFDINIVWRAFPLHPDLPKTGLPIAEVFGGNLEMMKEKTDLLAQKAAQLGLPLKKRSVISDSRLSQELGKWAETQNKSHEYHTAMYQAYFAEGLKINEIPVLLDVAQRAGLSRQEAESILESREFQPAVDADWELSETLEIMAAPTYLINGNRLVGAQSYEKLAQFLVSNGVRSKKEI
ncbi:MAG: thioredoxin domain-containing protein [Desulfobacteraceae bacterium]|nr:thioredoxin domain-containing protein [Desulfobacteraceae bacterium]